MGQENFRRMEWELFLGRDYSYHSGACAKDRTDSSYSYSGRKPVGRIVIGTVRISKDGSLTEVTDKGK